MNDLAEAMPAERERIAGALRRVEHLLTDDDWMSPEPVIVATDAVLPVVADLIAEAEKRGAAKALRFAAIDLRGGIPDVVTNGLDAYADAIESGEVAL